MSKTSHRFTATISRGDCFHRTIKGQITSASNPKALLHVLKNLIDHYDDRDSLGEFEAISIRISRIKPRKKS